MRFAKDILPLLIAGGGMAAAYKSGIFEDPTQKGNNSVWANLGKGLNADGSANSNDVGAPMQLPGAKLGGNPLTGSAPHQEMNFAFPTKDLNSQARNFNQSNKDFNNYGALNANNVHMNGINDATPLALKELYLSQRIGAELPGGNASFLSQPTQLPYQNQMQLLSNQQQPTQWANPATINYGLLGNSRGVA